MPPPDSGRRQRAAAVKRFIPYAIALAALAWVFHQVDLRALGRALGHAPIAAFIALSAVMLVINCAADTFAMGSVFRWFGCAVRYRDLFVVRASTYLLAILNYHVGQAAIVGYLHRACKVPLLRASGWILFIIGINVGTLFLLASVGASNARDELRLLRLVPVVCAAGVAVYGTLLVLKPEFLANRRLLAPLFQMGIGGHLAGVLVRLPHVGVLLVWHYISLHMFGVPVTPTVALLYLPAYFAVSSLPINVNGLGVAQLVALAFFAPFATVPPDAANVEAARKAAVMAYSLGTSTISILLQLVLGFAFLRRGVALGLGTAEPPAAPDEASMSSAVVPP
jgi:hypothetical protein